MNVLFFGTADFGQPTLAAIIACKRHRLVGAVTGPDKPRGRGRASSPTPVAEWLVDRQFSPIFKPERLSEPQFVEALKPLNADAYVVVAYRILPESVYTIPRYAFNLHASLLPAYRGAAPIQRALMAGETRTGVTTFLLRKSVDTGDIIGQREVAISTDENFGQLYERLSHLGAELVIETLDQLGAGKMATRSQDALHASPAPKISDADLQLDFTHPAESLVNCVRALAPKPGAVAGFRDSTVKIFALRPVYDASLQGAPGQIVALDNNIGPIVATGDHAVAIASIQPAGKRAQTGAEFIHGYHPQVGEVFWTPKPTKPLP